MKKQLLSTVVRGITLLDGEGAYSSEKRVLMTVVSREELSMKLTISEIDPNAFVNITETVEVLGLFRRS